ncbi:MAG TPA: hypothetical protein VNP53_08025 [Methylomirabilota bacterium]|nr:hypothetical protein [Methylomirabilota bacterium]
MDAERGSLMSLPTISRLLTKLTGSSTRADDVGDVVVGRIGWGAGAFLRDRAVRLVAVRRRRG